MRRKFFWWATRWLLLDAEAAVQSHQQRDVVEPNARFASTLIAYALQH
jgi:hypothetical protein